jgi:hypothetical protein
LTLHTDAVLKCFGGDGVERWRGSTVEQLPQNTDYTMHTHKCKYGASVTSTNFISTKYMVFINTGGHIIKF